MGWKKKHDWQLIFLLWRIYHLIHQTKMTQKRIKEFGRKKYQIFSSSISVADIEELI